MAQFDAELTAAIEADAIESYNTWKANSTEEQRAAGVAYLQQMQNEEFKAAKMAEYTKMFADADANGDGVLDEAEYRNWMAAATAKGRSEGHYVDDSEEKLQRTWALANRVTPGVEGISMSDMFAPMPLYHAKFNELKAADGLWVPRLTSKALIELIFLTKNLISSFLHVQVHFHKLTF